MGIKGLPAFLKKAAPSAFVPLPSVDAVCQSIIARAAAASEHAKPTVAVDVPSLFYRLMYSAEDVQAGATTFMNLFVPLHRAGIRVLFIFDGPHKPNKGPEHARRAARHNTDAENLRLMREILAARENSPMPQDLDVGAWMRDTEEYRDKVRKLEQRTDIIRPGDYAFLTRFLVDHGWVTLVAHDEGEFAAAWLEVTGIAHAVISDDFDVLPCGSRLFIRNFGAHKQPCQAVRLEPVLTALHMTQPMFLEFCILCGSDFTNHLHGMGPVKAKQCIQTYKSLDEYLASPAHKAQYGTVHFDAPVALGQFRQLRPPVPTKVMTIHLLVFLRTIGMLLLARQRARQANPKDIPPGMKRKVDAIVNTLFPGSHCANATTTTQAQPQ